MFEEMATPTSPGEPRAVEIGRASTWYVGSGLGEEDITELTARGDGWNCGGGKEEEGEPPRAWSSMGEEEKGIRISLSSTTKLLATWPRSWALPSPKAIFCVSVVTRCGCWTDSTVALSPTGTSTSGALSIFARSSTFVSSRPGFSRMSCTSSTP